MGLLWRDGHAGYNYNLSAVFQGGGATGTQPHNQSTSVQDQQFVDYLGGLLERCSEAIRLAQDYVGCGTIIRQSITAPGDEELQRATIKALLPNVEGIRTFFELSRDLGQMMPLLLLRLAELDSILECQLLACKLTELLQAVLQWDQLKMLRPQIQNDFASYRRYLPRLKREHQEGVLPQVPVLDTNATAVSMFIAENAPLMVALARVTGKTVREVPRVAQIIATVANMCCGMVQRREYDNATTHRKLLMGMVSAAVLYDRVTDYGVFAKCSRVGVCKCIKALNKHGGATGEQLRATLRYSTIHYNSATTPRYIRKALAR